MTEQEQPRYYTPAVGELFNHLKIGVLMLSHAPPGLIFANEHFYHVAKDKEKEIIDTIFKEIRTRKECDVKSYMRLDIEMGDGFTIGFTVYKLSEAECIVFLSDISHKQIFLENKDENRFYDRLSRIIAELAHEIGNPLASVGTALQVLQGGMDTFEREKKDEYIHRAITELDRLSRYLKKIRDFSAVKPSIRQETLTLAPLLNRVMEQHRLRLEAKNITVACNIAGNVTVLADANALQQVLLTLLLNSIDILPADGGGRIGVEVEEVTERFVKLVYRNNGPSIPPEVKKHVFMPFYTTKTGGSGIGLAVAMKIMTRMGGKIGIDTPEQGWGAKFALYIPVTDQ